MYAHQLEAYLIPLMETRILTSPIGLRGILACIPLVLVYKPLPSLQPSPADLLAKWLAAHIPKLLRDSTGTQPEGLSWMTGVMNFAIF